MNLLDYSLLSGIIMDEMLGNYYFINRNFKSALNQYEIYLKRFPENLLIKKRLIVCYIKEGLVNSALSLFKELLMIDFKIFMGKNELKELCPCREIINEFEAKLSLNNSEFEILLSLGILWFYCDANNSIECLTNAARLKPENKDLEITLRIISDTIINNHLFN